MTVVEKLSSAWTDAANFVSFVGVAQRLRPPRRDPRVVTPQTVLRAGTRLPPEAWWRQRRTIPVAAASLGTRLGMHVTDQELVIWRERAAHGPYRRVGDAMTNSPGDWDRIADNARRFVARPEACRWAGPTHGRGPIVNSSRWPRDLSGTPPRRGGPEQLRDAAFFAMVAAPPDAAEIVGLIRRELLWHTDQPALDFSNTRRYDRRRFGRGYNPAYPMSAWLRKLIYAFEYAGIAAPQVWSVDDRRRVLEWVRAAAEWYMPQIEARRAGMWDRDGALTAAAERPGGRHARVVWAGGPLTRNIHHRYNNHVNRLAVLVTDVGVLTGDELMKEYGRRWIREFLDVCVYPQGAISDFYRWDSGNKGHLQGWKYGMYMIGATMVIADHLARAGDPSGYLHATTGGTADTAGCVPDDGITSGGPKTLLSTARQMMRYIDEESRPIRYACSDCEDPLRRISSRDDIRRIQRVDDWFLLQGNVFYRDEYLREIYLRQRPGTPPLPAAPEHSLGWAENGDVGAFPAVNLMFAQMEGRVWPYPGIAAPLT